MTRMPAAVAEFLSGTRIAVVGVSRDTRQAANAVFRKLRESGYHTVPVNPNATELEGVQCYPDLASVPEPVDRAVVATHPDLAVDVVRECAEEGVQQVWFHRSFGQGSVTDAAIQECERLGVERVVGGCPLMYCEPVDLGHRCMRWWLERQGRVPRRK